MPLNPLDPQQQISIVHFAQPLIHTLVHTLVHTGIRTRFRSLVRSLVLQPRLAPFAPGANARPIDVLKACKS